MTKLEFYPGLHQPSDTRHFPRAFVSVNRLKKRKADIDVQRWIMDSGAFTEISIHGRHTLSVDAYADQIVRWARCGELVAACTQDYMCESFILDLQTRRQEEDLEEYWRSEWDEEGSAIFDREPELWEIEEKEERRLTPRDHQEMTVDRYVKLKEAVEARGCDTYLLPVLQGFTPQEYVDCIDLYEKAGHLPQDAYVGVGSVCKRNSNPAAILEVLGAILKRRPDLRLHGFGLKITALGNPEVRAMLASADSMAWSTAARHERNRLKKIGGDWEAAFSPNDWRAAAAYAERVKQLIDKDL